MEISQLEREFARQLATYLRAMQERAIQAARRGKTDFEMDEGALKSIVVLFLVRTALATVDDATAPLLAIGIHFDRAALDDAVVQYARQYALLSAYGNGVVNTILQDTYKRVREKIVAWLQSGEHLDTLIASLEPIFGYQRAETIAVTEITAVHAGSRLQTWRQLNEQYGRPIVVAKRWQTANDERVCPICAPLGGLVFTETAQPARQGSLGLTAALDGSFVHPGGNGLAATFAGLTYFAPPAHPRCRCLLIPVLQGEEKHG